MKQIFFTFMIASLTLVSCSSPESDGIKAAEAKKECHDQFYQGMVDVTQNFIENFESYKFETRVDARQKSEVIIDKVAEKVSQMELKADKEYRDLRSKYTSNAKELAEFEFAYNSKIQLDEEQMPHGIPNQQQINALILTIIPPLPGNEKIEIDLIGRTLSEQPNGYHSSDWRWIIEPGEVRDLTIVNKKEYSNECLYELNLIVQDAAKKGASYQAKVNVNYVLREKDDWEIEFLESKQMDIVKTGKYDNSITVEKTSGGWLYEGSFYLTFTNHSDVVLVVGGDALYRYDNQRKKFYENVRDNSSTRIGRIDEHEIHYIERP